MQRYFAINKIDDELILEDSDMHHIKNVMRMNIGQEIECIYDEILYICRINDVNINRFKIIKKLDNYNELDKEIIIAVGLVKEQKMDLILQKLTELGVSKIIPVKMERSIVKLDEKRFKKKKERWISICKEASEQSKRNKIPEITDIMTIKDLINYDCDLRVVCSVKTDVNLISKYLQNNQKCDKMLFVIGPEGGISDIEENILSSNGFDLVSLGARVLRVETACIYIASIVNFCSMR